jgi:hypothetical protein
MLERKLEQTLWKVRNKIEACKHVITHDGYLPRQDKVKILTLLKQARLEIDDLLQLKLPGV